MPVFTVTLNTKDDSLEVIGGKGKSLARMANAGFNVPGGFQVTISAYRTFVEENNLQEQIVALAKPMVKDRAVSFESASQNIRRLIAEGQLSDAIAGEINDAHNKLEGNPAVAVRSSANAEDLPGLSFAGQQETYLNVTGADQVVAAVKNCWASLWTTQAISYRHQNDIDQDAVAMAVVVQIMVPSTVSGILFTANPATGERSEIIINASFGLGEAVVSGQVTPDTYVVDKTTGQVKETMIGPKAQKIVADGDQGTRMEDVAEDEREKSSLAETMLNELVATTINIEALYDGLPQDIEWAFDQHGKLYLLQSRPITNLPVQPLNDVSWDPPPPAKKLIRRQVVENMPDPLCTLFEDLYPHGLHQGQELLTLRSGQLEGMKAMIDGLVYMTCNGYAYQRADWKVGFAGPKKPDPNETEEVKKSRERLAKRFAAMRNPYASPWTRVRNLDQSVSFWKKEGFPDYMATIAKWRQLDLAKATDEKLLEGIKELAYSDGTYWEKDASKVFAGAKVTDEQLQVFLRANAPEQKFTSGLFLSGLKSRVMQANEDLWWIAKQIQANPTLLELVIVTPGSRLMSELEKHPDSGAVRKGIAKYLDAYGHQGYSLDFVEPSQLEDPSAMLTTLKLMVLDTSYDPKALYVASAARRKAAMREAKKVFKGKTWWLFRWHLWMANRYYPNREEAVFFLGSAWLVLRPFVFQVGRRLVDVGTLAAPDDVFFLKYDELQEVCAARANNEALPQFRQLTADRRELREARKLLHPPGTIPPEISKEVRARETQKLNDDASDVLNGFAVSPGTIVGKASVINSAAEFDQMKPGTILVCPMTSPAWTQLFAHATGLVTDMGSILAHGSIVAREYGIPAVLGTGNITQRIKSGQTISVDGDSGIVRILADEDEQAA